METRWLTELAVSKILSCSVQKLRNDRCNHRGLAYYKIGKSVRYKMSDIYKYMESRKIKIDE